MQLAEQAGDENELWWTRAAAIFVPDGLDELSAEEICRHESMRERKQIAREAASYFEHQKNWEAFSEILDGYSGLQFRCGESSEAMATIQRRLQLADLSYSERIDAISSLATVSFLIGDYDTGRQAVEEALDNLRPGDPFEGLGNTIGLIIWEQFLTGRWSEIARFREALEEIRRRVQDVEGSGFPLISGYQALVALALSREDQEEVDALQTVQRTLAPQFFSEEKGRFNIVRMYRDGDFSHFEIGKRGTDIAGLAIMFFCEHEHYPPEELFKQADYYGEDLTLCAINVARALMANDNDALARAIDEAEEHHLVVHAAHMRIVLAKRTGDIRHLERARAVLERLEDRLFLRKLHEVEKTLQAKS